jgi:predicted component of type VI protein secretion system
LLGLRSPRAAARGAGGHVGAAEVAPASAPSRAIARVWLRGAGLDEAALAEAVGGPADGQADPRGGSERGAIEGLVALCHVTAQGGQLALEVVLGDGRVYQRRSPRGRTAASGRRRG